MKILKWKGRRGACTKKTEGRYGAQDAHVFPPTPYRRPGLVPRRPPRGGLPPSPRPRPPASRPWPPPLPPPPTPPTPPRSQTPRRTAARPPAPGPMGAGLRSQSLPVGQSAREGRKWGCRTPTHPLAHRHPAQQSRAGRANTAPHCNLANMHPPTHTTIARHLNTRRVRAPTPPHKTPNSSTRLFLWTDGTEQRQLIGWYVGFNWVGLLENTLGCLFSDFSASEET